MNLLSFINSRLGPLLGIFLGRVLSREQAYRFADWAAGVVARRTDSSLARSIRLNQAVVRGIPYDSPELDAIVLEVLQNTARGYADWYGAMAGGPEEILDSVELDEQLEQNIAEASKSDRGLVIAGGHMSSFNVLLLSLGIRGFPIQALSFARVRGSYHVDNEVRRKFGLDITPISTQSLRMAIKRLRQGGVVMTGIDRPDVGGDELTFFGRKVKLPVGHARLALQTNSNILVGTTQAIRPGKYRALGTHLIEPKTTGDRHKDVITLAQQVLSFLEEYIRARPSEWLMFFPIWPEEFPEQLRA